MIDYADNGTQLFIGAMPNAWVGLTIAAATIRSNVKRMLQWLSDTFFSLIHAVPAVFTEPSSPNFFLARAMIGLIAIALIAYLLVFRPYRPLFERIRQSISHWRGTLRR